MARRTKEMLEAEILELRERCSMLEAENIRLTKENLDLKTAQMDAGQPKNSRNAGRKSLLYQGLKERIVKMRDEDKLSFRDIAWHLGYSVGFVHKAYNS